MRSRRVLFAGLGALAVLGAGVAAGACSLRTQGATPSNLADVVSPEAALDDVSLNDAELDADSSDDGASLDTGADASDGSEDDAGPPCPCTSSGDLCCIPVGGATPYCAPSCPPTGISLACRVDDPNTASECCWNNGVSAGSSTALATLCGLRPKSCVTSTDCTSCKTTTCGGFVVGACTGPAPTCP
ncbi:MAG: hypothetical protein JWM74_4287 [Myxococcaceae bacterium]|nr:hypothetical protein [Myxococcaceae bacterium]